MMELVDIGESESPAFGVWVQIPISALVMTKVLGADYKSGTKTLASDLLNHVFTGA